MPATQVDALLRRIRSYNNDAAWGPDRWLEIEGPTRAMKGYRAVGAVTMEEVEVALVGYLKLLQAGRKP